jgi:hypothetical protein
MMREPYVHPSAAQTSALIPAPRVRSAADQLVGYRARVEDRVRDAITNERSNVERRNKVISYEESSVESENDENDENDENHELVDFDPNRIIGYDGEVDNSGRPNGKGKAIYANGDKYVGQFVHGVREGKGTMQYHNGTKYWGWFKNNQRYGVEAVQVTATGHKYHGQFLNDVYHGLGTWTYPNGLYGTGQWENGTNKYWNGYLNEIGTFEDDLGIYDGLFRVKESKDELGFTIRTNIREGYGVMTYKNGDIYSGNWYNNKKESDTGNKTTSTMEYNDGRVYKGYFKNDLEHGEDGVMTYPNGATYSGNWRNGMRHSRGKYRNAEDDAEYSGDWRDDCRHGNGTIIISNNIEPYHNDIPLYAKRNITLQGAFFKGEFNQDCIVRGVLRLSPDVDNPDMHQYLLSGSMNNNLALHGEGVFVDYTGELTVSYRGLFVEGKRHGAFEVKEGEDTAYTTEFRNDIEVESKRCVLQSPQEISEYKEYLVAPTERKPTRSSKSEKQSQLKRKAAAVATPIQSESTTTRSSRSEKATVAAPSQSESTTTRSSRREKATVTVTAPSQSEPTTTRSTTTTTTTAAAVVVVDTKRDSPRKNAPISNAPASPIEVVEEAVEPTLTCPVCHKVYTLEEANLRRLPEHNWICYTCLMSNLMAMRPATQESEPAKKKGRK